MNVVYTKYNVVLSRSQSSEKIGKRVNGHDVIRAWRNIHNIATDVISRFELLIREQIMEKPFEHIRHNGAAKRFQENN